MKFQNVSSYLSADTVNISEVLNLQSGRLTTTSHFLTTACNYNIFSLKPHNRADKPIINPYPGQL